MNINGLEYEVKWVDNPLVNCLGIAAQPSADSSKLTIQRINGAGKVLSEWAIDWDDPNLLHSIGG
jgi:hypothetical protein